MLCISFRVSFLKDGGLRIANVTKADTGAYTCVAENRFGTANGTTHLVVTGRRLRVGRVGRGVNVPGKDTSQGAVRGLGLPGACVRVAVSRGRREDAPDAGSASGARGGRGVRTEALASCSPVTLVFRAQSVFSDVFDVSRR